MRYDFAPLEGVTGYLFRNAHSRWFTPADRYFAPFFSPTQTHLLTPRVVQDLGPERNAGLCVVPQLLTKCATDFIWAARALRELGYEHVNLNLGCPSGTVVAKGKGSGFLGHPGELEAFFAEIFSALDLKISVKTRLGLTEPEAFWEILEIYNRFPISELIIHPRVQRDIYKNHPRMEVFEGALAKCRCPVVYNGDLRTAADCAAFAAEHPAVETVMIGRGLIANPALLSQAKGGPGAAREALVGFHEELYQSYRTAFGSDRNAMMRMKEVWFYLENLFDGSEKLGKRIRKATDRADFEAATAQVLRELPIRENVVGHL